MALAQSSPRGLISIREMASRSYQLKINYSATIKFRPGSYLKSPSFSVGGYEWMLFYYPRGRKETSDRGQGVSVSLYVFLRTVAKNVDAIFYFTLLENNGSLSTTKTKRVSQAFSHDSFASRDLPSGCWVRLFTQDDTVDKYLLDGHIIITCTVTILGSDSTPAGSSSTTPSLDFREDFANLWLDKEMLDVTFEVNGELFQAHKLVLAARSPVFKNILFGVGPSQQGQLSGAGAVQIEGMQLSVFKMMLQFIYTDSVPQDQELANNDIDTLAITQQLLAAADTYALTMLKLMCEERLCRELSIDSFATTLVLAEQHDCPRLKAACLYFASDPENLSKIALTDEYLNLSLAYPSILRALRDKCRAAPLDSDHSSTST
ncbi:BTB/POZ/MATH-domain protein [Rhynchospora pubera]|uniref:BTB/POZ/MATH-domain protein n=1 Tax=Rhynchospora pubera TaxID=906938 RepID=A0AAV8BQW7_9POAL|nr:BTB/POZ/MATH-domain protein [Rhynchospora pubera]